MKKHKWSNEELRTVLDMILLGHKITEWNDLLESIRLEIGVSSGSIKALYKSFSRVSQGLEPNPTKGGVGHNWGNNVTEAFNDWKSHHKLSNTRIYIIFS